ncbi:MAG: hypothetical protein LZF84_07415 [Nitrosomonas sp.]|nr:MAG: hypothetical protein LZF84_07415 [Nitrosomonas sp.]
MTTEKELPWFPGYEFQEFIYQSFLILPTPVEIAASPGATVTAKKWAKGDFLQGQAFNSGGEGKYTLGATLQFDSGPDLKLDVSIKGNKGIGHAPGTFEATGTGIEGLLKGASYALYGWVFPEEPIANNAARVLRVSGI